MALRRRAGRRWMVCICVAPLRGDYAALRDCANWSAERPPRIWRWMEFMVFWRVAISALEHFEKSVPFGYHLRTMRFAFSTDPFSQEA